MNQQTAATPALRDEIAAVGFWWHSIDLAGVVTPGGKTIVYREWPDARRFGEWALSPSEAEDGGGRKFDWRVGPAHRVGLRQGINEIKRMILEEEGWRWDYEKQAWDDSRAEKIERRLIDPRLGAEGIPSLD